MLRYEYKVVPAPRKGQRGKGVKGTDGKFAFALQSLMNEQGLQGWEYQRTDTLPCEERVGLTGRTTTYQNLLVFRRALAEKAPAEKPKLLEKQAEPEQGKPSEETPAIGMIGSRAEATGKAPPVGGVLKGDPGKTSGTPDVAAQ
jgi:hypothetical protein